MAGEGLKVHTAIRLYRNPGFWFVAPAFITVSLLLLFPIIASVFFSFTSKHLIRPSYEFVGIQNYREVLTDPEFYHSLLVSIKWTVFSIIGQLLIGFTAALSLNRVKKMQGFFRTALIIPWAFPSIVIAFAWKWILNEVYGFLPNVLMQMGITDHPIQFLTNPNLVFLTMVGVNIWFGAPLFMVNILSALQTIPKEQYEAAQIDGAKPWQSFVAITFHHVRIVIGLLMVLRTIWVFNNFEIVYLITGGGPADLTKTLPIYAYRVGWGLKQLGRASAVTMVLLLFLLVVSSAYFLLLDKWEKEDV